MAPLDVDIGAILFRRFGLSQAWARSYVVHQHAEKTEQGKSAEHGFEKPLPNRIAPGNCRILRQVAVAFGIGGVVEHVDHMRPADGLRIIDAGVLPAEIVAQLFRALLSDEFHVVLCAELEAAGRTRFDAGRFETFADAVGTERALVNALGLRIETRNIEGTTGHAEFTADA